MHWHAYFTPGEHWWRMLVAESSFRFVLSISHFFFFILNCPYIPRSSMKTQFSLKWRFGSPIVNGLLIVPCGDITSDKWLLSLLNLVSPAPNQCFACTMLGSCKHKTSIQRVTQTTADCHHFAQVSPLNSWDVPIFQLSVNYFVANKYRVITQRILNTKFLNSPQRLLMKFKKNNCLADFEVRVWLQGTSFVTSF